MVLEMSTGFVGAFGRQVTLDRTTAGATATHGLLAALEAAAVAGSAVVRGEGTWLRDGRQEDMTLAIDGAEGAAGYVVAPSGERLSRDELLAGAAAGRWIVTLTARGGPEAGRPQPAIWTQGEIHTQRGAQEFPRLGRGETLLTMSGRHLAPGAFPLVDGRRAAGTVRVDGDTVVVDLAAAPDDGMHLLQVQNPGGLVSNEFLFFVGEERPAPAADSGKSLATLLRESGWESVIGTWVDKATGGAAVRTTYAWKVPERVVEVSNTGGDNPSTAIMAVNAADGTVFQVGGDSRGGTFAGNWTVGDDGAATLRLAITTEKGERFDLGFRHELTGPDSMRVTIELPQPISVDLVRAKP
jgi:hypothetical protein